MAASTPKWDFEKINCEAASEVISCLQQIGLQCSRDFPDAETLNKVAANLNGKWHGPEFKGQLTLPADESRYYEEIIHQDNVVPTRENSWHDLFNACIWMQYPQTKKRLNQLHIEDIQRAGLHPRTPRRNRLTHFDECGVVLAVEDSQRETGNALLGALASHAWEEVFWHQRELWLEVIHPFTFGHANLEMMLSPFIGLTGKWLAVRVPDGFSDLSKAQQWQIIDAALVARIQALDNFQSEHILRPLPLLGVPGWWPQQTQLFYQNEKYFRPQRKHIPRTIQLPL